MRITKKADKENRPNNTTKINLIVYSGKNKSLDRKFYSSISHLFPKKQISLHTTIVGLAKDLNKFDNNHKIIIYFVTSKFELDNLACHKNLLSDRPTIFILPNQKQDFLTNAFKLYPKFISYQQSYIKDVPLVLQKMINNFNLKEVIQK